MSPAGTTFALAGKTVRGVISATAEHFGVGPLDIVDRSRRKEIVRRRFVAMAVVRRRSKFSLPEIARRFGGYDHTSILNAIRRAEADWLDDIAAVEQILERQALELLQRDRPVRGELAARADQERRAT